MPVILFILLYSLLRLKFSKESISNERLILNYLLKFSKNNIYVDSNFLLFRLNLEFIWRNRIFKNIDISIFTPLILTSIFIPSMIIQLYLS